MDVDLSLIKKWEGLRLKAYQCSAGVWTIGYGNTYYIDGKKVEKGDEITEEKSENLLQDYVKTFIMPAIYKLMEIYNDLPKELIESLVSLSYNVGTNCLRSENLKKHLGPKNKEGVANWFLKWKYAGGQVNQGLINRRRDEVNNFANIWEDN